MIKLESEGSNQHRYSSQSSHQMRTINEESDQGDITIREKNLF